MPESELNFFSMASLDRLPLFSDSSGSRGAKQKQVRALRWYREQFESAPVIGERSTSYLNSPRAAARMKKLLPDLRIVILLRNPVDRAYSHYWHNVRTGRAVVPFRQAINGRQEELLTAGLYQEQVRRFLTHFDRSQVCILLFERFVQSMKSVLNEIESFLGLEEPLDPDEENTQRNPGRYPISYPFQLHWNQISRRLVPFRDLGSSPDQSVNYFKTLLFQVDRFLRRGMNVEWKEKPEMDPDVRQRLERFFRRKNRSLGSLLEMDLSRYWPFMENA